MPVKSRYVTYGGKKCLDPTAVRAELRRLGLPMPEGADKTNGYHCPRGFAAGIGYVFMTKADAEALPIGTGSAGNDLVFYEGAAAALTVKGLRVIDSRCISNAPDFIDKGTYILKLADARHFLAMDQHVKTYNVRTAHPTTQWASGTPAATQFDTNSLNAGSVWTWATMLADLWTNLAGLSGIGSAPTLPFSPTGVPENFRFYGVSPWQAIKTMLDKIGCSMVFKPETGGFEIVRNKDDQSGLATFISDNSNKIVLEESPRDCTHAIVPNTINVYFPRRAEHHGTQDDAMRQPSTILLRRYEVYAYNSTTDFSISGVTGGTGAGLWDDMPAIIDPLGNLKNGTELTARASEIAEAYIKSRAKIGNQKTRRYAGALSIRPGSELTAVAWRDNGRRCTTTIEARVAEYLMSDTSGVSLTGENLAPPDDQRRTLDTFPNVVQWVQFVEDSSGSAIATPNANGFYAGRIKRAYPTSTPDVLFVNQDACFIAISDGYAKPVTGYSSSAATDSNTLRYLGRQAGVLTTTPTGGSSETRPLYVIQPIEKIQPRQGKAKTNWKKQTPGAGNWPSRLGSPGSEQYGYVEVDNVIGESSTSTTFRVYIPTKPAAPPSAFYDECGDEDPNVVQYQTVSFIEIPGKTDPLDSSKPYYQTFGSGYTSASIGTVQLKFNDGTVVTPSGWRLLDGSEDATKNGIGIAVDMAGYFPIGNTQASTTTAGGVTIDDTAVAAALAPHPLTAAVGQSGAGFAAITSVNSSTANASHTGSGTDITISEANSRPKSRGVYWYVRYDNAAN
jgi:hypothetical protein